MKTIELHSTLSNRFEIVRRLGAGGYGEVFEAIDHRVEARVAVKRLWHADPDAILRFKREFRTRQDIEHPNLVHVGELLEVDGEWLLTMELIVGTPWLRFVRRDPMRLASTARQVAEALSALHDADLIHCDVKPSNVLVTRDGRAVLLDLGLVSRRASALDAGASNAMGTAWYMAPEQAVGAPFGPAADLYALGACMYEGIAGRAPFEGEPLSVIFKKLQEEPPAPSTLAPFECAEVERVCLSLLHRDADERPSAREVVARLEAIEGRGLPVRSLAPAGSALRRLPFVGRETEIDALVGAFEHSLLGEFRSAHVQAESGLGKTRLVERFLDGIERPGLLVLSGRCFDRESVPYNAFDGVFDALAEALSFLGVELCAEVVPENAAVLAKVFPVLGRVPGFQGPVPANAVQEDVFAAAAALLASLAERYALVLAMDDFQWADDESVAFLRRLFLDVAPPPILLVLSSRVTAQCRPRVRELFNAIEARHPSHLRVALGPLGDAASAQLARTILGSQATTDAAMRVAREARGEPLFIAELAHAASATSEAPAAISLEASVLARASRLDLDSRLLLGLVALSAGPVADTIFASAAGLEHTECRRRVLALRGGRLVRTDRLDAAHRVEIIHDRVRAAILEGLDQDARRGMHARLAQAMTAAGVRGSEDLAYHLLGAGRDEDAAYELVEAALRAAEGFAFDRAARLYAKAMVLGIPRAEEASCALLVTLGNARSNEGKPELAATAYATAAEMTTGDESLRLRCRALRAFAEAADVASTAALSRTLCDEVGVLWPPGRELLRSLAATHRRVREGGARIVGTDADARDGIRAEVVTAMADTAQIHDRRRAALARALSLELAMKAGDDDELAHRAALAAASASFGSRSYARSAPAWVHVSRTARTRSTSALDPIRSSIEGVVAARAGRFLEAYERFEGAEDSLRVPTRMLADELAVIGLVGVFVRLSRLDLHGAVSLARVLEEHARRRGNPRARALLEAMGALLGPVSDGIPKVALPRLEATLPSADRSATGVDVLAVRDSVRAIAMTRDEAPIDPSVVDALTSALGHRDVRTSEVLSMLVRRSRGTLAARIVMASHDAPEALVALASADALALARARTFCSELYAGVIRSMIETARGDVATAVATRLGVLLDARAAGHLGIAAASEQTLATLLASRSLRALPTRTVAGLDAAGIAVPEPLREVSGVAS